MATHSIPEVAIRIAELLVDSQPSSIRLCPWQVGAGIPAMGSINWKRSGLWKVHVAMFLGAVARPTVHI
jgi:hypothetical protein